MEIISIDEMAHEYGFYYIVTFKFLSGITCFQVEMYAEQLDEMKNKIASFLDGLDDTKKRY